MEYPPPPPPYAAQTGKPGDIYGYDQPPSQGTQMGQQHTTTVVVTNAPVPVMGNAPNGGMYMAFAIITCLCCCWPLGIVAIIFAARIGDEVGRGDYETARSSSKISLGFSTAALVIGSVALVIVIVLTTNGALYTTKNNDYGYYGN